MEKSPFKNVPDDIWNQYKTDQYNYKGRAEETGYEGAPKAGHDYDSHKLPNHITFSNDSIYHTDETPGGQWSQEGDGKWHFYPSDFNLKQHPAEELKKYFDEYEKESVLHLPEIDKVKRYRELQNAGPGE
jgi:hypothetical protein